MSNPLLPGQSGDKNDGDSRLSDTRASRAREIKGATNASGGKVALSGIRKRGLRSSLLFLVFRLRKRWCMTGQPEPNFRGEHKNSIRIGRLVGQDASRDSIVSQCHTALETFSLACQTKNPRPLNDRWRAGPFGYTILQLTNSKRTNCGSATSAGQACTSCANYRL